MAVLLFIVVLQTMKEYSWKSERFWVLLPDCCMVLIAEVFVDWLKHAFITRFNELQLDVYRDYTTSLAYDMAQTRQKYAFSDHSDLVARRMGFIPLPLGVVVIRVLIHAVHISDISSVIISVIAYIFFGSLRILNSILILGLACKLIAQHKQEKATLQSPSMNRANSPVPVPKTPPTKDWLKDTATSPQRPVMQPPGIGPTIFVNGIHHTDETYIATLDGTYIPPPDSSLGSTAIFSNSTVDLKNVSLNEELLKVEGEKVQLEDAAEQENITKSDPNINCEFIEDILDKTDIVENGMKKRAESEPSLNNLNDVDDSSK